MMGASVRSGDWPRSAFSLPALFALHQTWSSLSAGPLSQPARQRPTYPTNSELRQCNWPPSAAPVRTQRQWQPPPLQGSWADP